MKLTLFYAPVACSLVPYVALTEAGADFDVRVISYRRGDHLSAEYLRMNPKHKVPVLLIDGAPLSENVAILQWIARHHPEAHLLPTGGLEEFRAIAFLSWCASGIHPALTPNALPQRYCDLPDSAESVRRCAQLLLTENYRIAEDQLGDREWFFDSFSLADAYFFWAFRRGTMFGVDVSGLPRCRAHLQRMMQRSSVQKVLAFESAALAAEKTV
jgi:glutathione S-transferase